MPFKTIAILSATLIALTAYTMHAAHTPPTPCFFVTPETAALRKCRHRPRLLPPLLLHRNPPQRSRPRPRLP